MKEWEKGTALGQMIRNQEKAEKGLPFAEKAGRYRENSERVVNAERLVTLIRGFLTEIGGLENVSEESCKKFVHEHFSIVDSVMSDVPKDDFPAAIYALAEVVVKGGS